MMIQKKLAATRILLLLLLLLGQAVFCWSVEAPPLKVEDCQLCHTEVIQLVAAAGAKHRDAVSCVDCHREHPPRGTNAIPACALCHDPADKEHYSVSDCLGCHKPHTPLQIEFNTASRVAPACATCHPQQTTELLTYPSNHSLLDCKSCHLQHGQFLSCQECHEPHLTGQTYSDCRQCHQPHSPLKVVYLNSLDSSNCIACHAQPGAQLLETTTKHRLLLCVYCHKSQHKRIPKCETCHFEPHDMGMHEKFPDCVTCHGGPHNLVN